MMFLNLGSPLSKGEIEEIVRGFLKLDTAWKGRDLSDIWLTVVQKELVLQPGKDPLSLVQLAMKAVLQPLGVSTLLPLLYRPPADGLLATIVAIKLGRTNIAQLRQTWVIQPDGSFLQLYKVLESLHISKFVRSSLYPQFILITPLVPGYPESLVGPFSNTQRALEAIVRATWSPKSRLRPAGARREPSDEITARTVPVAFLESLGIPPSRLLPRVPINLEDYLELLQSVTKPSSQSTS